MESGKKMFLNRFIKQGNLGEGTYGVVYKCFDNKEKDIKALKQIKLEATEDEGIPSTTIREIAIL